MVCRCASWKATRARLNALSGIGGVQTWARELALRFLDGTS